MNKQSIPAPPARIVQQGPAVTGTLPHWDHLPPERRRELTATLAALVVKQLARPQPEEGRNE